MYSAPFDTSIYECTQMYFPLQVWQLLEHRASLLRAGPLLALGRISFLLRKSFRLIQ